MSGILILGAGGHAKVIARILVLQGMVVRGFLDNNSKLWGETRLGLPVLGGIDDWPKFEPEGLIIGIGNNQERRDLARGLASKAQRLWCNAIHPQASVDGSAELDKGIAIGAKAVVNADSRLGQHVIVNTGATVDHDCIIGDFAHVAPGVNLGGRVVVGEGAFVGIGSSVIPGIRIGEWSTVGAGSVVVNDVASGVVAFGVPAKSRP